jgi:hypothetical protein
MTARITSATWTFVPAAAAGTRRRPTVSITQAVGRHGRRDGDDPRRRPPTISASPACNFKSMALNLGSEVPTASLPSGISWDSTSVANGSHLLTAVVHDAAWELQPVRR